MATISILANTVRPSQIGGYDLWVETFSWQDPVHSWKAGPGEVIYLFIANTIFLKSILFSYFKGHIMPDEITFHHL